MRIENNFIYNIYSIYQKILMIKKFFTQFDMFGSFPTFRMRGDSETMNLCGGISSLLILLFFTYIFIIQTIDIINFEEIQTSTTQSVIFYLF